MSYNSFSTTGGSIVGVYLSSSRHATFSYNNVSATKGKAFLIGGTTTDFFNHTIDTTNLVSGKPILYVLSNSSFSLQNNDSYGQIYLADSNNAYLKILL